MAVRSNGAGDVLAICECRDRRAVADVTWVEQVVAMVNKDLTAEAMHELNARGDLDKKTAEDVAGEYLSEPGLVQ